MIRKYFPLICIVSIVMLLCGCATKMQPEMVQQITNHKMVVATMQPDSLRPLSRGKSAIYGVFNVSVAGFYGDKIVKENSVEDPAILLSKSLSKSLSKKYSMKIENDNTYINISENDYSKFLDKADFLLVVRTIYWGNTYHLTDSHLRPSITFSSKIIDLHSREVIVSDTCRYFPSYDNADKAPTWESFYENGAIGFKEELKKASDYCVKQYMTELFTF